MEEDLSRILSKFFQFSKLSFYFPSAPQAARLEALAEEGVILLPARWRGGIAGMIKIEGAGGAGGIIPHLEALAELALERLYLERLARRDLDSGLSTEAGLFEFIEDEIEAGRSGADQAGLFSAAYRLCLGMVVIRWPDYKYALRTHDMEFAASIHNDLARRLAAFLPRGALAARLGKLEGGRDFGLIFNAGGREACARLALGAMNHMEGGIYTDPLSGRKYSPRLFAGCALYPQDMTGEELRLPLIEQGLRLKRRAAMAAGMAADMEGGFAEDRVLAFASIAGRAGRVLEGGGKIRINLGKAANVREGMRFFVWGRDPADGSEFLKGQITVIKADADGSDAEVFYLNKAERLPQRGDRLSLPSVRLAMLNDLDGFLGGGEESPLLSHAEFLAFYSEKTAGLDAFLLIIIRLAENGGAELIKSFYSKWLEARKDAGLEAKPAGAGEYGKDRLAILLPGSGAEAERDVLAALFMELEGRFACGIGQYPFLDFTKAEVETNALKALEYAELLPKPRAGVFNSMAMTISADKKFSMGDNLGAIEEYRRALLADSSNALAANSLGVCLAALGKTGRARIVWEEALDAAQDRELKAKVCYNLGALSQQEGDCNAASRWYRACLRNFQKHAFAWIRMGQLSEIKGRKKSAKRHYLCAANLSDAGSDVFVIARRRLARLDMLAGEESGARSGLHQLLLENPHDCSAMNLLARLYLNENGDPAIAEMLAKKSLQINDNEEAWRLLAESLRLSGREAEAEKALQRIKKSEDF